MVWCCTNLGAFIEDRQIPDKLKDSSNQINKIIRHRKYPRKISKCNRVLQPDLRQTQALALVLDQGMLRPNQATSQPQSVMVNHNEVTLHFLTHQYSIVEIN